MRESLLLFSALGARGKRSAPLCCVLGGAQPEGEGLDQSADIADGSAPSTPPVVPPAA
jgi:hypothetical protein